MAHRAGGQILTGVGPGPVLPVLDGGGEGAARPEGLHGELPVVAVRADQGGHDALNGLGRDVHLPVLVGRLGSGGAGGGGLFGAGVAEGDGWDMDEKETAAEAGENGHND